MRPTNIYSSSIKALLHRQKVATMPELMKVLGTNARRTVFRKLEQLEYRTSYSHRGRFYTVDAHTIPNAVFHIPPSEILGFSLRSQDCFVGGTI